MRPAVFIVTCLILLATLGAGHAQTAAAPAGDGGWPKQIPGASPVFLYQPQVDSWTNNKIGGHAAVRVASTPPAYGVVWFAAQTENMKDSRMVILYNISVTRAEFPGSKGKSAAYKSQIQQAYTGKVSTVALDRLQTSMIAAGVTPPTTPVAVQNNPPAIIVSNVPAMLIRIYGAPVLQPVAGGTAQRVVNTPALIVTDGSAFYLYLTDRWLQASSLTGTYDAASSKPAFLATALSAAKSAKNADLFPDPGKSLKTMLAANTLPSIYVTTAPTELVVTKGKPSLQGVAGTSLQMVTNTKSDLFFYTPSNAWYLLAAGRWFSTSDLAGTWTFVPGAQLPADFARIPISNPHAAVLVSVPGTSEAKEAVIADSIPQTATINRASAKFTAFYAGGAPSFQPISETSLQYAVNSAVPVIQVSASNYYALDSGVWFQATMPSGPWWVATSVPAVVYQIPPSSPLYNVTFVKIYGSTADVVYTGYTPGYFGTIVGSDGTVVYGTGYDYAPYVNENVFVAPPVTYGPAASYFWGAASGYVLGAATSALWGPGWGYGWNDFVTPYWGVYGTPVWASGVVPGAWGGAWSASSDVYRQWGNAAYRGVTGSYANAWTGNYGNVNRGVAYNARNGAYTAGTRVSNTNAYTGVHSTGAQGVHYNPNTGNVTAARGGTVTNPYTGTKSGAVHGETYHAATGNTSSWGAAKVGNNYYASRDGNVYHANGDNWTHPDGARFNGGAGYLDGQAGARAAATDRWGSFARDGGWNDRFGGGFRTGGAWGGGFRGFRR